MHIPSPTNVIITPLTDKLHSAKIEIFPLYPGYGHTVGNSLRRVLLSSLQGAGITSIRIQGADHEFTTIPYVKEEVLEIILNIKQLNITLHTDTKEKLTLHVKGKKTVTGVDFEKNPNIVIINPTQLIATLTHKEAELEMTVTVEKGLGFSPVEEREKETEVGVISVDTTFSSIRSAGYVVEAIRVGKRTDYDKVILTVQTNGAIAAEVALHRAASILVEQFSSIVNQVAEKEDLPKELVPEEKAEAKEKKPRAKKKSKEKE